MATHYMNIEVKRWVYMDMQEKAQRYNRTLLWEAVNDTLQYAKSFRVSGHKIAETEKAVQFDLYFWNLRKAGRYVTDAPVEGGWKVWIPKSAIIKM